MTETDDYGTFILEMLKYCNCCPHCIMTPCDGVLAGGLCDDMCRCSLPEESGDDHGN